MPNATELSPAWRARVADARRAVLTTLGPDGRPHAVPICFVLIAGALYSPLDEKPKRSADPRTLRRIRNLAADPRASVLVDQWDEDWSRLWFVDLVVRGAIVEPGNPGHAAAVTALRAKYAQYRDHDLERRAVVRLDLIAVNARWSASATDGDPRSS